MEIQYSHNHGDLKVFNLTKSKDERNWTDGFLKKTLISQIMKELNTEDVSAKWVYQVPHIKVICLEEVRLYVIYQQL